MKRTKPKKSRPVGRPSKLSPEVKKKLIEAISEGNYREPACAYAGIGLSTFSRWMEQGRQDESGEFREFWAAIRGAEAKAEIRALSLWQKAMPDNWQAARDFLDRRHPGRWAPRVQVTLQQEIDVGITRLKAAFAEDPEGLERALSALAGDGGGQGTLPDASGEVGTDNPDGKAVLPALPEH